MAGERASGARSSHYLSEQRDPILGEFGLISGKLPVVAGEANLAAHTLFEGIFLLGAWSGLDPLVVPRRMCAFTHSSEGLGRLGSRLCSRALMSAKCSLFGQDGQVGWR